jgi:hypothetical protein
MDEESTMSEEGAPLTFVEGGEEYELSTSGEGGYRLRFKTEKQTAVIEGEDATRFKDDYATVKEQYPEFGPDQRLAQLWDQGGYSWMAVEDEA